MSNEFDSDLEGWSTKPFNDLEVTQMSFEDMLVANLQKGKSYIISYRLFPDNDGSFNLLPKSNSVFTIDNIVCTEITDKPLDEVRAPAGMSPSYFHLLKNTRKKKGFK